MSYYMSLDLQQKPTQSLKQLQRLIMSRQMQQAIHVLQMPIMELSPIVETELQQNPVLECLQEGEEDQEQDIELQQLEDEVAEESPEAESALEKELTFDERDFEIMRRLEEDFRDYFSESGGASPKRSIEQEKLQTFLENSICASPTLFEHLMRQAQEAFKDIKELALAETLIGSLDESGFLTTSLEELASLHDCTVKTIELVLAVIQTFHPCGIAARNLKESLLIQLRCQNKQETLAYAIIEKHFDDLLHNRVLSIQKGLQCNAEQINAMVDKHIAKLDLHPGAQLSHQIPSYIVPDVSLKQEGENLVVAINEDTIPRLRLNAKYLRMLDDDTLSQETKDFIQQKITSGKWLLRNLLQRNNTLEKIAQLLAVRQQSFFLNPDGKLVPLTMKTVAEALQMHESTIARAVANKYIDTPRGLLALRTFFTNGLTAKEGGEISSHTVREILQEIINKEDKRRPFSDEAISILLKEKGIQCARRTVAKYRGSLNLGSAQQRRKYKN